MYELGMRINEGGRIMNRTFIHLIGFVVILAITYGSVQNPYTTNYITSLKNTAQTASKTSQDLLTEIKNKSKEYEELPQNAQIHKVWKAMPGYNGLVVDIDKSYEKMKKDGVFNPKKLVYKEVPPKVQLQDLPAAPVYRGHPDKKMVTFLVNVAWGNEYIPDMLKVMKKHGVRATFFLEGKWVKNNPELAKMIVDSGHEVGNHSYSHPDLKSMSSALIRKELKETNNVINAVTEKTPVWFAPPSGSFRDEVVKIAHELNMRTVLWSVDTIDWKQPEPAEMVARVVNKIHPGALILMHPTSSTARGLDSMIKNIKEKGYQIGNASTLLNEDRVK